MTDSLAEGPNSSALKILLIGGSAPAAELIEAKLSNDGLVFTLVRVDSAEGSWMLAKKA